MTCLQLPGPAVPEQRVPARPAEPTAVGRRAGGRRRRSRRAARTGRTAAAREPSQRLPRLAHPRVAPAAARRNSTVTDQLSSQQKRTYANGSDVFDKVPRFLPTQHRF